MGAKRFHAQKWLLDHVISQVGLDWDQLRMASAVAPAGATPPYPVVVMMPGVDTFKEQLVWAYGDKILERGMAALASHRAAGGGGEQTGRERSQALPQVPTLIETGVAPLEMDSWIGFFIGSRTPQAIIDRLRTEIAAVIATPDVATRLERDGGRILHISIAESEAYVQAEVNRWRTLIPQAGISVE